MASHIRIINGHEFVNLKNITRSPIRIPCVHCQQSIWGWFKQGYRCQCCNIHVHQRCLNLVVSHCDAIREGCSRASSNASDSCCCMAKDETRKNSSSPSCSRVNTETENGIQEINNYSFIRVLAKEGSYAKVLLAQKKTTRKLFAIKALRKDVVLSTGNYSSIKTEKKCLTLSAKHPFLIGMHSCFQTKSHLFFVMEYASGCDMVFHLKREIKFAETRVVFYAAELTLGLNFLHRHGIIHRNLKLENILLGSNGHCLIGDFGMSKEGILLGVTTFTLCGSPTYMAPEIITGNAYGTSVDWWALGVAMYTMLTGKMPFYADNEQDLFYAVVNSKVRIPFWLLKDTASILRAFFEKDPAQRLGSVAHKGAGSAVRHDPYFQGMDWDALELLQIKPPFVPTFDEEEVTNFEDAFVYTNCASFDSVENCFVDFSVAIQQS